MCDGRPLCICGASVFASCTPDSQDNPAIRPEEKSEKEYSIFIMSDIHVMAPELLVERGTAFDNYIKSDPKLLEESGEVLVHWYSWDWSNGSCHPAHSDGTTHDRTASASRRCTWWD